MSQDTYEIEALSAELGRLQARITELEKGLRRIGLGPFNARQTRGFARLATDIARSLLGEKDA